MRSEPVLHRSSPISRVLVRFPEVVQAARIIGSAEKPEISGVRDRRSIATARRKIRRTCDSHRPESSGLIRGARPRNPSPERTRGRENPKIGVFVRGIVPTEEPETPGAIRPA